MATQNFQESKKIARQSFEAFEKKDYNLLEKVTDANKYRLHFPGQPTPLTYEDSVKLNKEYNTAFPDTKVTVENQIAEGDFVVTRVTFEGTHKGEFQGISPSNKKLKVSGLSMQKIENGKITEEWSEFDALGMMQQIGAVPETLSHESVKS